MELRIDICSDLLRDTSRICFLLPKRGNDVEFMALDHGMTGFQEIMDCAIGQMEVVESARRNLKAERETEDRYLLFLRLKDEFEPEA